MAELLTRVPHVRKVESSNPEPVKSQDRSSPFQLGKYCGSAVRTCTSAAL